MDERVQINSVVQITEMNEERQGWIGCFVQVSELKSFGIQGWVQIPETHQQSGSAYIRLNWEQFEYIGQAVMCRPESEE